ncbi:MAG: hypothetical protein H6867_04665 [Rhodospirillales bacterium]|nr:hypothetical protein [Rhodospirillales bacterium]
MTVMHASTVGGGAMTLVFRPVKSSDKQGVVSAVKVPLAATQGAAK